MREVATIALATALTSLAQGAAAATSITAIAGTVKILEAARHDAEPLGLFRAGQTLALREPAPVSLLGCSRGWYAVAPRGFVCASADTTFDPQHERAVAARLVLPSDDGYPFQYGRVTALTPRHLHLSPPADVGEEPLAAWFVRQRAPSEPLRDPQPAYPGMKLAWARELVLDGKHWVVTPDLQLIDKRYVEPASAPLRRSLHLTDGVSFPFALPLHDTPARDAAGEPIGTFLKTERVALAPGRHRAGVALSRRGGRELARTADGDFVEKAALSVFNLRPRPAGVGPHEKWVHVRINEGALIAYEGDAPVFAAVVSPGMHGANPAGAYHTPTGRFRVSSKHKTSDMGGPLGAGSWRSRAVPWVAYYDDGFALHGAWWHDAFGRPKSHGCINLTPGDAAVLFAWLEPSLPRGWYGVRATAAEPGTVVLVTP